MADAEVNRLDDGIVDDLETVDPIAGVRTSINVNS
jgi:hypothetical protein